MRRVHFSIISLFVIYLLIAESAFAFRCGRSIISIQDFKANVVKKCGEPTIKDQWEERHTEIIYGEDGKKLSEERKSINIEEWTYNFGSRRFLRFLKFEDGKLTNIEIGTYGYDPKRSSKVDKTSCRPGVVVGDRKIDVIKKCGEPTEKEEKEEELVTLDKKGKETYEYTVSVHVDKWLYNFGPRRFMYTFTFKNGKIVNIEKGGYGY